MVKYNRIIQAIDNYVQKCGPTLDEMKILLDGWSISQKKTLLYYGLVGFDEKQYDSLLENGSDEEIFEYEREIFENLSKSRWNNLLTYCNDFQEKDYNIDEQFKYTLDADAIFIEPIKKKGVVEQQQDKLQESKGYSDEFINAINRDWTGGHYEAIQDSILNDKELDVKKIYKHYLYSDEELERIKKSPKIIEDYIKNSEGLVTDTVLYRGGHWDIGLKVGDVKKFPLLLSASYNMDTAQTLGINWEEKKNNRYMIKIYAPKGTKGCNVDAPSLSHLYEHEYLMDKNQKYVVLNVNDDDKTASILLI